MDENNLKNEYNDSFNDIPPRGNNDKGYPGGGSGDNRGPGNNRNDDDKDKRRNQKQHNS